MNEENFFLDTNILVYAYSSDEPEKRQISQRLLDSPNAVLSTQVLNEFLWVMNRKAGIGIQQISEIVQSLVDTTPTCLKCPGAFVLSWNDNPLD